MKKWRKAGLIFAATVLGLLVLVAVFISPITKYLIEKNSEKFTGRQITIKSLGINIFTGSVTCKGLTIFEAKSNTVFVSCEEVYVNIAITKLLKGEYDIETVRVSKPVVTIVQKGKHFNYDDLMKRFMTDTVSAKATVATQPAHYWVHNFAVDSAKFTYSNTNPFTKLSIIQFNTSIPLIAWDDPVYKIHNDFALSTGGKFSADMVFNKQTLKYSVTADLQKLNIAWMYPYLKDYMKVNSLQGLVGSHIRISGNLNKPTDIAASGMLEAEQFSMIDNTGEKLTAVEKMNIKIDTVNTAKNLYSFSEINVNRPFIRISMYDKGFNYERIMTSPLAVSGDTSSVVYSNIFLMMSGYIQEIVKEYDVNNYKIGNLKVTGGQCIFSDFTHGDKFRYVLDSLNLSSSRINSNNPELVFQISARLNTSGKMSGVLKVNPKNYKDIDINAQLKELLITDFNPYSKYYVATPFLNGKISYVNQTTVKNNILDSKNVLDVVKLTAGKKIKTPTAMNLPVKLAVSLLKDVKGNIHIDIPVKGSLNDPKFKMGKVIWELIKNLIIKAATAPFRLLAGMFGGKEEDFKEMHFDYLQSDVQASQQENLDRLAKAALEKPDLKIELVQVTNKDDEAEAMALLEAREKYLGINPSSPITPSIKQRTDSIAITDSLFVKFVNAQLHSNSVLQSTGEKCVELFGKDRLQLRIKELMEQRNKAVSDYLLVIKKVPAASVSIINVKDENQLQKTEPPKYVINIAVKE